MTQFSPRLEQVIPADDQAFYNALVARLFLPRLADEERLTVEPYVVPHHPGARTILPGWTSLTFPPKPAGSCQRTKHISRETATPLSGATDTLIVFPPPRWPGPMSLAVHNC